MPIYEYRCESCSHEFEKIVKVGAEPPPCPECGEGVRKLVSAAAFSLKGSGWYRDHYGLKPSGGDGGASSRGASSGGASSGGASSGGASSGSASSGSSGGSSSGGSTSSSAA